MVMTADELIVALRERISDPSRRIDMTTVDAPALFAPASRRALDAAEAELGFALPPHLRLLYAGLANGGFGPGAGLVGVEGGHLDAEGHSLAASYGALRRQEWPNGLLPLCDLGDGAWSCVDALAPDERIVTMDESGPTRTRLTLSSWLEAWVTGLDMVAETFELEDAIMTNPFTRRPMAVKRRGKPKGSR